MNPQSPDSTCERGGAAALLGERAICIGSGLTGLCVARVLSEHFREVLIIERRPPGEEGSHAVHANHLHNLIDSAGLDSLEALFPGFDERLSARGGRRLARSEVMLNGELLSSSELETVAMRALDRNAIDSLLREDVRARARCRFLHSATARRLVIEARPGRPRVRGVELADRSGAHTVQADLVVDASGRRAFSSGVLAKALGIASDDVVADSHAALISCRFERPAAGAAPPSWASAMHLPAPPASMTFVHPLNDREWLVTVYTRTPDPPPVSMETLLREVRAAGPIFDVVSQLRPLGKVSGWRDTANIFRRHLTGRRLPGRLLVVGDAACATNPLTSSGMSVAAVCATKLRLALRTRGSLDERLDRYNRDLEGFLWRMWQRSAYFELRELVDAGQARGTLGYHAWNTYLKHVLDRGARNEPIRALRRSYYWFDRDVSHDLFKPSTVALAVCNAAHALAAAGLRRLRAMIEQKVGPGRAAG